MPTAARDETAGDPTGSFVGFAHALRAAGLPIGADRTQAFVDASVRLGAGTRRHVYWAGRATLCASALTGRRAGLVARAPSGSRGDRGRRRASRGRQ